jgi:hypothetical protein
VANVGQKSECARRARVYVCKKASEKAKRKPKDMAMNIFVAPGGSIGTRKKKERHGWGWGRAREPIKRGASAKCRTKRETDCYLGK